MTKKDEWGNIELPGISDEELLNKDWNRVARSRDLWNNLEYVARMEARRKELMSMPDWKEKVAHRAEIQKSLVTNQFREHMSALSKEKWQDSKFRDKAMQSRAEYWADPNNHDKRSAVMQEVAKRPEVKAAHKAGAQRRSKDPNDLALRKEVGARNAANPDFARACQESVTPERIDKFKASTLKYKDPVVTPLGVFRCVSDAAQAHEVDNGWIRRRINKVDPTNYRYISIEEYIMLSGTEL